MMTVVEREIQRTQDQVAEQPVRHPAGLEWRAYTPGKSFVDARLLIANQSRFRQVVSLDGSATEKVAYRILPSDEPLREDKLVVREVRRPVDEVTDKSDVVEEIPLSNWLGALAASNETPLDPLAIDSLTTNIEQLFERGAYV
jgi:hypothetical protein